MNRFPVVAIGWPSLLIVMLVGCGKDVSSPLLDQGVETVHQGLEAWKSGQSPDSLESATSPLTFFDDDWNRRARLVNYQIHERFIEPSDGTARVVVTLTVKTRDGKQREVRCAYQVVFEPRRIVARDPMS